MTKHTDDSERPQPLGLPLNDLLGPLLDKWAADEYVQFVSRSGGQRTTATVSRDALRVLAERAAAAERELCAALASEARRQFEHWVSQRQHAEETVLRLKVLDALAAIARPNARLTGPKRPEQE